MKKRVLIALFAALLLVSAAACKDDSGKNDETTGTETGTKDPNESYIVIPGTDSNGNDVTYIEPVTNKEPTDTTFDPTETNPTFTDCSKTIVVVSSVATVRTATTLDASNAVGWPSEGRTLTVTGESDNWYRITYKVNDKDTTCYIAKTVADDAAALEGFTAVNEEVIVATDAVNVRSYPSVEHELSIRGVLHKGDKVTRVGVSDKWSKIRYELVSETETDAEGNPVKEWKEYYISNDCLTTEAAQ